MKFLAVLNQLLALIHVFLKNQANGRKRQEVERANEDPTEWFNGHFNAESERLHGDHDDKDIARQAENKRH